MHREEPLLFTVGDEQLLGISSLPTGERQTLGVLILVGGAQYRAGSHRQFVLLARALADAGFPALRFDFRGMGDSDGGAPGFEALGADIAAASDAFFRACPDLQKIVLWGLCDAASAALLDWLERRDPRLAGLVLLNPWVRSESGLARTRVKHYYRDRLLQREFWAKLFSGRLGIRRALVEAFANARRAHAGEAGETGEGALSFQQRMAAALRQFSGPVLLVLSGADYTAREFADWADDQLPGWQQWPQIDCCPVAAADHTFSSADWRRQVEQATLAWLTRIEPPR